MREEYWNLIAKHQSNETTKEEELFIEVLVESNEEFKLALEDSTKLWDSLEEPIVSFDKNRISDLIDKEINKPTSINRKHIVYQTLRYVAIFIGLLIGVVFIVNDLNSTVTIASNDIDGNELTLPDGSKVQLNKDAEITYSNSVLRGFNRKVSMNGEAFFSIEKSNGRKFTVNTQSYDIVVLGTKFNVKESEEGTSVVLVEGSIKLNSFEDSKYDETMIVPGQLAYYCISSEELKLEKVNTSIYTAWMLDRLEFDNFSLSDLAQDNTYFTLHRHIDSIFPIF
jgi:ferric-dicitrate binding protein FerR (iron transport regulator)